MNRQEKKCFITVASAHGLMVVILFVGPAFFVSSQKSQDFQPVTVYSAADITKALSGGEKVDNVRAIPLPPPPTPTPEPPKAAPQPIEVPPPPKNVTKPPAKDLEVEKPTKPTLRGDEPEVPPKKKPKHQVTITPDEMTQNNKADQAAAQKKTAEDARRRAQAQAAADAKRQAELTKEFGNMLKSLNNDLSGRTVISIKPGAGGGGAAAVNYFQLVQSILDHAWHPSETLGEDTPTVTISIVISRDGTLRGHISKRSGNNLMDNSVQNVLDTVGSIEPFPADFTEQHISATFTFNIKAKR